MQMPAANATPALNLARNRFGWKSLGVQLLAERDLFGKPVSTFADHGANAS